MYWAIRKIKSIEYNENSELDTITIDTDMYSAITVAHQETLPDNYKIGIIVAFSDAVEASINILPEPVNTVIVGRHTFAASPPSESRLKYESMYGVIDYATNQLYMLLGSDDVLYEPSHIFNNGVFSRLLSYIAVDNKFAACVYNLLLHKLIVDPSLATADMALIPIHEFFKYVYSHNDIFAISDITDALNEDRQPLVLGKYMRDNNVYVALMHCYVDPMSKRARRWKRKDKFDALLCNSNTNFIIRSIVNNPDINAVKCYDLDIRNITEITRIQLTDDITVYTIHKVYNDKHFVLQLESILKQVTPADETTIEMLKQKYSAVPYYMHVNVFVDTKSGEFIVV